MLLFPGQSNDPRSPHYRDQYNPWTRSEMQPMTISRAAVDARAVARTVLQPGA